MDTIVQAKTREQKVELMTLLINLALLQNQDKTNKTINYINGTAP
jgi:hypothetical protein